jgi:hypothetical protein
VTTLPDVDAALFDAALGGFLHRREKRVVHRIERLGKRAVDDSPVDLRAKVELDDVVHVDDGVVAAVG